MTVTTTGHTGWIHPPAATPPSPAFSRVVPSTPAPTRDDLLEPAVREHIDRIVNGTDEPGPDPAARARMAAVLHSLTGWAIFENEERAYVSRLWAEDWDCPEDAVYDDR